MRYTIKCCGPSKDYFDKSELTIDADSSVTPSKLKSLLLEHVKSDIERSEATDLLKASMIASDKTILDPDVLIENSSALFLLPPVCGG